MMGKNKDSRGNNHTKDICNSTVKIDIVKTKKDWFSIIISIISLILSLAVLIGSIVQINEDKRMNRINSPLKFDIQFVNGPNETKKMVNKQAAISSVINYKIKIDKQNGELYDITIFSPASLNDNTFIINNYSTSLEDFENQVHSIELNGGFDLHFAFSFVRIMDTNKNVIWAVVAIPIPSKSFGVTVDKKTNDVTVMVNYETAEENSKNPNVVMLFGNEVFSDSDYLANKIFDSYYETDEQKEWARQQRTHTENIDNNQINQGKLYSEIDEASKEELMSDVEVMKNAFLYVYNHYNI